MENITSPFGRDSILLDGYGVDPTTEDLPSSFKVP